jgi:hypothetical protein
MRTTLWKFIVRHWAAATERRIAQSTGFRSESKTVWVERKPGEAQPVTVTIGKSDDLGTQILSGGLTQGDCVIIGTSDRGQSSALPTPQ